MLESLILGAVQGITEWLPVSSEGVLVLVQVTFFGAESATDAIRLALFLHLGTFLAALVYLRRDVWRLLRSLFSYADAPLADKVLIKFLITTTVVSGVLGLFLFKGVEKVESFGVLSGDVITLVIGVVLLVTAGLLLFSRATRSLRTYEDLSWIDALIVGIGQGIAAIPGISRSGTTVSLLLLRKVREEETLRVSFLMSLPVVLGGNIILQASDFSVTPEALLGLLASFFFGLLTIDLLLRFARRVNFGLFVLFFGLLTIFSVFI